MKVESSKRKIIKEYLERRDFGKMFVKNMKVLDPLDRICPIKHPFMRESTDPDLPRKPHPAVMSIE